MMKNVFDVLTERGFIEQASNAEAIRAVVKRPITCYVGFDPSADSFHVGHLVPIMALAHMQRHGHRPIAIMGGGTGMVGDPTDKDARTKDFLPVNLAQYSALPDAFTTDTRVKNWGCFGSDMSKKLWAVANTKTLDEVRKVKDTDKTYSSADVMRELKKDKEPPP